MNNAEGIISGVVTAVLIVLFAALIGWCWSGARRKAYDAAARLPLEEDQHSSESYGHKGAP
ncbi:MAG: CcoQ/FixQ family Cbb3-type cytochrome c oxidase assembly chaperone [Steroidobacteraceae bacterium]|jgi:cytochrome c oxidase cbb3-type subunit 4